MSWERKGEIHTYFFRAKSLKDGSVRNEDMCKGKLKCWYTNASGMSNKLDEFHACIDKE